MYARLSALVLSLLAASAQGQPLPADELQAMLAEVSPARIEARIRKLVSFGTRHTLSDIASETRGIGAARRWITSELSACAKAAGGRLQVEEQSFIEPAGNRVNQPTELVNVVATLPGRGASKGRTLVVSGHYDSRNEVAGYRIVWRDTDSAAWQQSKDVGKVSRATLAVSKDNVVFGVQAVSKKGYASLASYPLPKR